MTKQTQKKKAVATDPPVETIHYAIGLCRYGSVLCATSKKGICAIYIHDKPKTLLATLKKDFPATKILGAKKDFKPVLASVIKYIKKPNGKPEVKLDLHGTEFQKRVWKFLSTIRAGKTLSYSEVAMHLGSPGAARTVGNACAANKIAILIPCHRVLRLDGSLSGYRWGLKIKKELLKNENAIP